MPSIRSLLGTRIYLDTNVFIYAVEGAQPLANTSSAILQAVERSELEAVTSELMFAEALVDPFRRRDSATVNIYLRSLDASQGLRVVPVSRNLLVSSARLRAGSSLKLADAIHVATAMSTGCDAFVTNDDRLRGVPITIVRLADLTA